MKQIIYTNKQGYSETHIFDNSGSIVSVLNSDAYLQVSLSVTPEKTNEVVKVVYCFKCIDIFVSISSILFLSLHYFLFLIQDANKLMRRL